MACGGADALPRSRIGRNSAHIVIVAGLSRAHGHAILFQRFFSTCTKFLPDYRGGPPALRGCGAGARARQRARRPVVPLSARSRRVDRRAPSSLPFLNVSQRIYPLASPRARAERGARGSEIRGLLLSLHTFILSAPFPLADRTGTKRWGGGLDSALRWCIWGRAEAADQLRKAFCRCTSGGMLCIQVACASSASSACISAPPRSPPRER